MRREDITLLVAETGLDPASEAAARAALGDAVGEAGQVVINDPGDRAAHTALGAIDGLIARAHHRAVEADLLIATGAVAPDEYAGYSGGADTVAVGCADADTQRALRSARFLDDAAVRAGRVQDNPFQRILREIGRRAGLLFIVNVVADPDTGAALAVAAGAPAAVHDALVAFAAGVYEPEAPGADYDVVVLAGDDGGRWSLFEASSGISGSALGDRPVLRPQGILIAQARCGGEPFDSPSAGDFYGALAGATSADILLRQLRGRSLRPGEERAFRLAQVLAGGARVVLCDPACGHSPGFGLSAARTLSEAAEIAESYIGRRPRALIVPLRGGRLPVPGDGEPDNPFGAWGDDEP